MLHLRGSGSETLSLLQTKNNRAPVGLGGGGVWYKKTQYWKGFKPLLRLIFACVLFVCLIGRLLQDQRTENRSKNHQLQKSKALQQRRVEESCSLPWPSNNINQRQSQNIKILQPRHLRWYNLQWVIFFVDTICHSCLYNLLSHIT